MDMEILNGDLFINMLVSASNNLENQKEEINKSNVFPVPDGDTGTNMSLTFVKAAQEILTMHKEPLTAIADKVASASLRGARGNSGVILSQFFRGISKGLKEKEEADIVTFAEALKQGTKSAYRAVMKPTEGTILTVMKGISEKAGEIEEQETDFANFFKIIVENGKEVLATTPELLPKLKQAGVVDSGGMGLMAIMEGMSYYLLNNAVVPLNEDADVTESDDIKYTEEITYTYLVKFSVLREHRGVDLLHDKLSKIGDNVKITEENNNISVGLTTDTPDLAIAFGLKIGQIYNIEIENLRHQEIMQKKAEEEKNKKEKVKYGFVSVTSGDGFKKVYEELGITGIISGGQSMNPSTDDILNMAVEVNAETVFVFPNNKNIILAANQAKQLFDGELIVIPTTSMAQVFPVMMMYDEEMGKEELTETFNETLKNISFGQITYAVRDSMVNDIDIKEGDIMEMVGDKVVSVSKNIETGILNVIDKIANDETEVITIYAGKDIKEKDLKNVVKKAEENHPDCDITALRGEQPIYYYIVSAE